MKCFKIWKEKITEHKNSIFFSLITNLIVLVVLVVLFRPLYESNDDTALSNIVDGARGVYCPNLVFINRILGYLLCWLYQTFALVPWYGVLHYIVLFTSFTAISYVMFRRMNSLYQMAAYAVFLFTFAYEAYIQIQFTKTAGIATAAGVLLLLTCLEKEKIKKGVFITGCLLALIGSMYRFEQFLLEFLLMSGIGMILFLKEKGKEKGKLVVRAVIVFFPMLVLAGGLYLWDRSGYETEEWQSYMEYNKVRGTLYDFTFPSWEQFSEQYEQMGMDKDSWWMYSSWNHLDDERFSIETMRELIAMRDGQKTYDHFISDFFKIIPAGILKIPCFYAIVAIFLFWILCGGHKKEEYGGFLYQIVLIAVVYLYLFYAGRYLRNRVDVVIWLTFGLTMLWGDWKKRKRVRMAGFAAGIICACLGVCSYQPALRIHTKENRESALNQRENLVQILADKDELYLHKTLFTIDIHALYEPFDRIPEGIFENVEALGGWLIKMPMQNELLERFQVSNPLRDIVDREDIYIADTNINLTLSYIRKWYHKEVSARVIKDMGRYQIYQIYTPSKSKRKTT